MVQWYSTGSASVHPHPVHVSLGSVVQHAAHVLSVSLSTFCVLPSVMLYFLQLFLKISFTSVLLCTIVRTSC